MQPPLCQNVFLREMCLRPQMCLEMVIALSLRNRDRLLLIWPAVHDLLASILAPGQQGGDKRGASPLVARAALGLLRVCQRLLPYKEVRKLQCLQTP